MKYSVTDAPRNSKESYNMQCGKYRRLSSEFLAKAKALKPRYLSYKEEYGADDSLTIKTKERAIRYYEKSVAFITKLNEFQLTNKL